MPNTKTYKSLIFLKDNVNNVVPSGITYLRLI
jgi:hypothetical protein